MKDPSSFPSIKSGPSLKSGDTLPSPASIVQQNKSTLSPFHTKTAFSSDRLCDTCGIKTHEIRAFGWKRLPVSNENVYKGVCVRCYGELVPANVFLEWSSANSSAVGNLNPSAQSLVAMNDEPALTSPTSQAGSNLSSPKASFNIQNIDSINKDLQVKYWLLVKFFQSCRNDPLRPTPEDLQGFTNFTGEDWRKVLLIQNETGCLFLHLALMHMAPYTAIHFLLKKDLESSWTIHHEDVNGRIPLHYACQHGATLDVFELLLREDQGDRKKTIYHADKQACFPLHMACQNSCKSTIIQFLLDKDMENRAILKKDSSGHLPIHLALERNATVKIIQMLVNADILKSSLHALNPSGMSTILEIAMRYDYATLLQERHIPLLDTAVEEMNIHTACRFGVPLQSIQILLEMDSNQSIYQTDQDLNLPLHCALDGSASIDTIRYLIKLDTDKSTLYQRNKDGSTPLLKIVLRQDAMAILHGFPSMLHAAEQLDVTDEMNVSIKQKCEVSLELQIKYTRLISIICQRRDLENRPYLSELSNLDFSEETWRRVVLIENDDTGWLPIHWAFAFHAPSAVVEFLIEKDLEHLTIFHRNLSGSLPLHFACLRGFSFEVIHSLLDKDVTRATIHQKNNMGKRPLDLLPKDSDVIPNLVKDVRNNDTTSKTIDFFFQSSPPELFKRAILEIMDSKDCLSWLNHAYCQDAVVIFVVLEFYLLCAWIGVFVYSSILHLKGNDLQIELAITLQAIAFLQLVLKTRRLAKVGSLRSYFAEFYNFLGFATIALVGASSIMLSSKETFGDERALIMATGVLQFTLLLVCLKRVFYSLATFVGGIVQICFALIPFFIVSTIILIAFSFLFLVNRYDTEMDEYQEYQTLADSFGYVFGTFVGSLGDDTLTWLDVVFATISIIVLLNVAIAIVNHNWRSANTKASRDFWVDRLNTVLELAYSDGCCGSRSSKYPTDVTGVSRFLDAKKEMLQANQHRQISLWDLASYYILYTLLFIVGLLTFGLLWPQELRRRLFAAPIISQSKTDKAVIAVFERKMQILEDTIEWHQRLMDRKMQDEFDELKEVLLRTQGPKARGLEGARVNWTGTPQRFPPGEILVE